MKAPNCVHSKRAKTTMDATEQGTSESKQIAAHQLRRSVKVSHGNKVTKSNTPRTAVFSVVLRVFVDVGP